MEKSTNYPTVGLISTASDDIRSFLKKISTQLLSFSKIWSKKPCNERDEEIYNRLLCINRKVSQIQNELTSIAGIIGEDIECEEIMIPDTITLTAREFYILNEVFLKYTDSIQDAPAFSLFST